MLIKVIKFTKQDKELFDSIIPGVSSGSMNGISQLSGTWSEDAIRWQAGQLRQRDDGASQLLAHELERMANEGPIKTREPERCKKCGIALEWYGVLNNMEGWHLSSEAMPNWMNSDLCENCYMKG